METLVIAEAGVNHNGDLALALELVDKAKAAGADMIKFQSFSAHKIATRNARKASYQRRATSGSDEQLSMLRRLELSRTDHEKLFRHCMKRKITFFSTAFDEESFDMLINLGVQQVKIPSGEITNFLSTDAKAILRDSK